MVLCERGHRRPASENAVETKGGVQTQRKRPRNNIPVKGIALPARGSATKNLSGERRRSTRSVLSEHFLVLYAGQKARRRQESMNREIDQQNVVHREIR